MELSTILLLIIFLFTIIIVYRFGRKIGAREQDHAWQTKIPQHRKEAIERSRAVLSGQFSEQLAPFLPGFPYKPTECSFLGKPIDLIVFKGADKKEINEVVFLEIKTGKSQLNKQERSLKNTIEKGKVRWEEYRVDEEITSPPQSTSTTEEAKKQDEEEKE